MRLIHVVPFYLPATRYGGPVYAVHGLCRALARQGHDVRVFTTNLDGAGDSPVPIAEPVLLDGVSVHYYRSSRLRRVMFAPRLLRDLAGQLDHETVLHVHSVFTFPSTAAARLAQYRGVPYVVSPHGALVARLMREKSARAKQLWLQLFDANMLARAGRVHVTSHNEQRELEALGLQLPELVFTPLGVEAEPPAADIERAPYALFLGRISWVKGLDRALEALVHTRTRLVIAGRDDEGLQSELTRRARALGVDSRVQFVGPVEGPAKWSLLRGARFLLLPSYSENFGMVVAEALAAHCPALVTPEVGAAEIVRRAQAGLVADGSPDELGAAMEKLWSLSDGERAQLGRAGARYAHEHLSWDAIARVLTAAYEALLHGPSAGAQARAPEPMPPL